MQFSIFNFQFSISKAELKSIKIFAFLFVILTFSFLVLSSPNGSLLAFRSPAHAQLSSVGIANYLEIIGGKAEDGDIIVTTEKGYAQSTTPYDNKIVGIVSIKPAVSLKTTGTKNGFPVVSTGTAVAKVTDEGGNIKKGDFVTTSSIPGAGMKAEESGYVIGEALEAVNFGKKGEIKLILVSINPHHVQGTGSVGSSLLDLLKLGRVAADQKPSQALKYIVATLIVVVTFGSGFLIFGKTVNTGIEALGRNPLASRQIQLSIIFNIIMILAIITVGTGLAYLVIRL